MVIVFDVETTGLNPYESKVILVGMKKRGKVTQWKLWESKDEASMILPALGEIDQVQETILGYNNLKFDVPFVLKRLEILGRPSPGLWDVYSKPWFDLYQYLGNDYRSLRQWLEKAGIKRQNPELDGRDMPGLFQSGRYDKIEAHNLDDLNTSEALFRFLKSKNPEILPFD